MTKKLFIIAALACLSALVPATAATVEANGDTTVLVSGDGHKVVLVGDTLFSIVDGDSTRIMATGLSKLGTKVCEALSDTVLDKSDEEWSKHYYLRQANERMAMIIRWGAIIILVFIGTFFYYWNRRNKYRMIEKAIDAGYQLPPEALGYDPRPPMPQQPIVVTPPPFYGQQPGVPQPAVQQPMPQPMPMPQPLPVQQWPKYDGAVKLIAIGVALMLFFWAAGSIPMIAIMSILLFLGIGKAFTVWQQRKDMMRFMGQNGPAQPQQPQQPNQPQS